MILPRPKDALHKAWLYRLLTALIDDFQIGRQIFFKGGTCASMLGYLDRFSIDLDFDIKEEADKAKLRLFFHRLFKRLDLKVKDESQKTLQFFLKYSSPPGQRNTLKLDIIDTASKASQYKPQYLEEIDRYMVCQTIETMFAHKLVTVIDRYEKNKTVAGRDIYDLHCFFLQGLGYTSELVKEKTKMEVKDYLKKLVKFIEKYITQTIIDQDLNTLLPKEKFDKIRKILKRELSMLIKDEIKRFP